jgi:hypothetical protein
MRLCEESRKIKAKEMFADMRLCEESRKIKAKEMFSDMRLCEEWTSNMMGLERRALWKELAEEWRKKAEGRAVVAA